MRTTLLKHTLPDGSWHIDWLIEVEPGEQPRVPTFRLADRPDRQGIQAFDAEQLPYHRRLYLDFSGDVSGGRGRVDQLASGPVIRVANWPQRLDITAEFEGRSMRWLGSPTHSPIWRFEAIPIQSDE